jgi:hypothetical protein
MNIGVEVHTNTCVADTRVHTLINTVIMSVVWNAARSISIIIADIHGMPCLNFWRDRLLLPVFG